MAFSKEKLSQLFGNKFDIKLFKEFIGELFNTYPENWDYLPATADGINYKFMKLFRDPYIDNAGVKIDILVVKIEDDSSIEKARAKQRRVISTHLSNFKYGGGVQNVLVAFHNEKQDQRRLSYVKQEFVFDENKKLKDKLTPAKRSSFLIDPLSKNVTVKKNFEKLLNHKIQPNVKEIETAFSVEAVTKEFFGEYVKLYQRLLLAFQNDEVFIEIQQKSSRGDEHFVENFVKKLMGQIIFLYFLQKKGWLGVKKGQQRGYGSKTFVRDLYEECKAGGDSQKEQGGIGFFNDYLEHLFYDTLNKQRENNWSDYFNCHIPYLNGGLFEPMNNYIRNGKEHIMFSGNEENNNKIFGDILDTFDLFNFTVYENDPLEQDVAIDPEMLGKIFENLLPDNERKGKGAFYTPREIVHYMCKESIKQYLVSKTGLEEKRIEKLIRQKDSMLNVKKIKQSDASHYKKYIEFRKEAQSIDEALQKVKIVDPAVGSGAFPMGLLKEIVSIRRYIKEYVLLDANVTDYQLKKETLENCIYGVDIDPGAVEIAKLRFWLSLVVDNNTQTIDPLPNLDYKIMQGNSLVEQFVVGDTAIDIMTEKDLKTKSLSTTAEKKLFPGGINQQSLLGGVGESESLIEKIKYYHKKFFNTQDHEEKKKLKRTIDGIENDLITKGANEEIAKLQTQIDHITNKAQITGAEISEKDDKKITTLQQTIDEVNEMKDKFTKENIRPFFPWRLHFSEVFKENGGFDVVIGNPPYVGEKGNKDIFRPLTKGNLGRFYQGKMDLFYFFFHLALDVGKENAQNAFITTNYYITASGARNLRADLKARSTIRNLVNFNELRIFESALGQHNLITIFSKGQNSNILAQNCITSRTGNANEKILNAIVSGKDKKTQYYKVEQEKLYDGEENYIRLGGVGNFDNPIEVILEKVKNQGDVLGGKSGICNVNTGLFTASDKIFIKDEEDWKNSIPMINNLEKMLFKPLFKNSDIYKFSCNKKNNKSVLYHYEKATYKLKDIPNILSYLNEHQEKLKNRKDNSLKGALKRGRWDVMALPKTAIDFTQPKIVAPQRSKTNTLGYNEIPWYASADVYFITVKENSGIELKYILALLNSKLYFQWLYHRGKRKGEMLELYQKPLSEIPIKKISTEEQKPFIDLVDKILEITSRENYDPKNPPAEQKKLEAKIDKMVYELYGLSEEEVKVVEESL